MIRLDVVQGSPEWISARLGIPTASRFSEIITNKTAKLSESSTKYAWELIAEQVTGAPVDDASSGFMVRGTILEQKAVRFYEMQRDVETEEVGFILRDDRRVGCSPDRLVGEDGLLEIKVPNVVNHIGFMIGDETIGLSYRAQVQGQLWLTGRKWLDSLSYNPGMPSAIIRVERDEDYIAKLAEAVDQFLNHVEDLKDKLVQKGFFPELRVADIRVVA